MGPLFSALFVGASFATSLSANRSQAKIQAANTKLQVEQSRLQASEAALERTKTFKNNMSTALALRGMGYGSNAAFASLGAESYSNYMSDIASLDKQQKFAVATGQASNALTKSKRFQNDLGAVDTATSLANKLGLFSLPSSRKKK